MNETVDSICVDHNTNWLFTTLTAIYVIITWLSLSMNVMLLTVISQISLFQANLKWHLKHLITASILSSFGTCILSIYNVLYITVGAEKLATTSIGCLFLIVIFSLSVSATTLFTILIGIDRYRATKKITVSPQLEDVDKTTKCAKVLAVSVWFLAVCWETVHLFDLKFHHHHHDGEDNDEDDDEDDKLMCYCSLSTAVHFEMRVIFVLLFVFSQTANLALLFYVYRKKQKTYKNFNLTTSTHSLQHRYHLSSNMKSTAMLIPYLILRLIFGFASNIAYIIFMMFIMDEHNLNTVHLNVDMALNYINSIDLLITPYIWIRYQTNLRNVFVAKFPIFRFLFSECSESDNELANRNDDQKRKTNPGLPADRNFNLNPDKADEILQDMWATKSFNPKRY